MPRRSISSHSRVAATIALNAALCLMLAGVLAEHAVSRKLDVPYVPTPQPVVEKMLELADVKSGDFLIDLGSGDGRIPITAAKKHGVNALGVDLNPERVEEARANAKRENVADKVEFREQNLFETDLGKATVITMYLLNDVNMKLRPKLMNLKPGTRIVSHSFDLGDWKPDRTEQVDGRTIHMWTVGRSRQANPAKAAGQ